MLLKRAALHLRVGKTGGKQEMPNQGSDFEGFLDTMKAMFGVFLNLVCCSGLLFYSLHSGT